MAKAPGAIYEKRYNHADSASMLNPAKEAQLKALDEHILARFKPIRKRRASR